ncbi:MAG: hypothetical protein ABI651_19360 [Verrucomicrobiota bacterium]
MPPDKDKEKTSPPTRMTSTEPNFTGTPQPISEFTCRADFPQCTRGVYVDIRGFAGVVVDIVNQSIKVRSPEGITQSFNANRLKTLYAPPDRSEPAPMTISIERPKPIAEPARPKPVEPPRVYIAAPDFTAPVLPINDYAGRPDFPKCAYGKHVDIVGYTGVVVEIVKGSLKIQSATGATRSYNSDVLKKLYGKG